MRKLISSFLLILFSLGLVACSSTQPNNPDDGGKTMITNSKTLVVYFSATNTTERVANLIKSEINSDIYEILAKVPYTSADLAYYTGGRADQEQNNPDARPEIGSDDIENFSNYDYIFLGYPIWHGQAPRIISTFLERYNFSGKTIIPFCTSQSSGIGSSDTNLHKLALNATWKSGKRFSSSASKNEVKTWVDSLNIKFVNSVAEFNLKNGTNGNAPKVLLSSNYEMPIVGLGTYSLTGQTCVNAVKSALAQGYRMIDTASFYGNEVEVGQAIRESGIPREEIFVITKIYPGSQYLNPEQAIQDSLDKLDIGYIDMMLLHHPGTNDEVAYKAMEKFVKQGKIHSIGLSNWYIEEIDDFISKIEIKPALIQNEIHPYYQETAVVKYMHNLGIVMQAWYPLGGRGHTSELLNNETIKKIASNHNVSSAQVILRWDLQNGVVVIPGSSNSAHQLENISLFDFELTEDEMQQILSLNRNEKHDWY